METVRVILNKRKINLLDRKYSVAKDVIQIV
jgi:hypothetical protein